MKQILLDESINVILDGIRSTLEPLGIDKRKEKKEEKDDKNGKK
jgi:hypothetical protein